MSAFVDLGFVSFEVMAKIDSVGLEFLEVGLRRSSVVRTENDQRVVGNTRLLQGFQDIADDPVGLDDKVCIVADSTLSPKIITGRNGSVRRSQREVEEEG